MSYGKARELLGLALYLAGRNGATLADIENEMACDRRRAQRMLAAVRDLLPQLERRVDEERRPRWSIPVSAISPLLAPTPDELAALSQAVAVLGAGPGRAEVTQLVALERKVRAMVPVQARARVEVDEEALLESLGLAARPGPRPVAKPEVDQVISHALKSRQLIRILYASRNDAVPRWRTIEPYGLLLGARRYLVAIDTKKRGAPRYYRVQDIQAAEPCDEYFDMDVGFDLAQQAKKGFGSFERPSEYGEVIWRFSKEAAAQARQFQFHPDQQMEARDDGSLIVRFVASGFLEMAWHLYMWGDQVEVISPPILKQMISGYRRSDFPALP